MSSFEKTAGTNLDEILASIRKTLADESTPPAPSVAEPDAPAEPSPAASAGQNGAQLGSGKLDDDLADLLAGGLATSPASSSREPTDPANLDPKDPLWFLRPRADRETQGSAATGDRRDLDPATPAEGNGMAPAERSSLPPLFVTDPAGGSPAAINGTTTPAPARGTAASPPSPGVAMPAPALGSGAQGPSAVVEAESATARAEAISPLPADTIAARLAVPKDPAAKAEIPSPATPQPSTAKSAVGAFPAAASQAGAIKPAAVAVTTDPVSVQPLAKPATPGEPVRSPAAAMGAPMRQPAGLGQLRGTAAPQGISNGAAKTLSASAFRDGAGAAGVAASQTQAMEQIIEQLLEPLLRRWVEANLPRLVDTAIRAEVARALDAKDGPARKS
jgi:cell pole-organizing protein PopZ